LCGRKLDAVAPCPMCYPDACQTVGPLHGSCILLFGFPRQRLSCLQWPLARNAMIGSQSVLAQVLTKPRRRQATRRSTGLTRRWPHWLIRTRETCSRSQPIGRRYARTQLDSEGLPTRPNWLAGSINSKLRSGTVCLDASVTRAVHLTSVASPGSNIRFGAEPIVRKP